MCINEGQPIRLEKGMQRLANVYAQANCKHTLYEEVQLYWLESMSAARFLNALWCAYYFVRCR